MNIHTKRIFVINGHPGRQSLSRLLAEAYQDGALASHHEIRVVHLHDLQFDLDHENGGYQNSKPLEPALESFLLNMEWAEHIVMTTPMWWGGMPAKLKGLFDRAFVPGRAFNPRVIECGAPKPLLKGKSARVIITSDTPSWFMRLFYRNALFHQIRKQLFRFVGITPTRFTHLNLASHPTLVQVTQWQDQVRWLGSVAA
ncbi:MAG: NAD(P)H-dependent oxidoreductase [Pseudomonadota bacterium]